MDGEIVFVAVTEVGGTNPGAGDDEPEVSGTEVLNAYLADTTIAGYVENGIDMTQAAVSSSDVTAYVRAAFEAVENVTIGEVRCHRLQCAHERFLHRSRHRRFHRG